ncbi:MAG: glutaminyl-peptide cyclotransferase [Bacteroidales bacterium]
MSFRNFFSVLFPAVALFLTACSGIQQHEDATGNSNTGKASLLRLKSPLANTALSERRVTIEAIADSSVNKPDSLVLFAENERIEAFSGGRINFVYALQSPRAGRLHLSVRAYAAGKLIDAAQTSVLVLAEQAPREISFTVVKKYPHDSLAYTQGLYYEKGWLYESTGQYHRSSLRKVKLATGEIDQSLNLAGDTFGEGLAVFDNSILQITWKSKTGYIYEKETFREIRKVNYQTEGWGVCYDGEKFYMSDGSEILYLMDKENFAEIGRVEVYDNKGAVKQLNELEFIKGEIFANVYGEKYIVVIDPTTGFVTGKINLAKLIPAAYEGDLDKALNGIAWIPSTGHLLVTGKDWPVLYELALK